MRYMYCSESLADEGCHEVQPGIFGRPVHNNHRNKLKAKGWLERISDFEPSVDAGLIADYEAKFGKKPHHKMKRESILRALKDDEAGIGEQNSDPAGG